MPIAAGLLRHIAAHPVWFPLTVAELTNVKFADASEALEFLHQDTARWVGDECPMRGVWRNGFDAA